MPYKLLALICLCMIVLVALQPDVSVRAQSVFPPQKLNLQLAPDTLPPGLAATDGTISVMIELVDPPALSPLPAKPTTAEVRTRAEHIKAAQAAIEAQLGALGARKIYSTQLVYNGIAVTLPATRVTDLRQLPGVRDVHMLTPKQILSTSSVSFVQAPQVWGGSAGNGATGAGVRIGIIDSGIDYTHADFGGSGNPSDYTANNSSVVEPGSFPTAKVIGGEDLAGDAYDPVTSPFPVSDPDPLDCNGHGTLVASTAAGFGVTTDGRTYTGAYNSALDFSNFSISPGVAPQAQIYALKVLGCNSSAGETAPSTDLIVWAIDRAMNPDNHLDVLLIPLGTPFGSSDDPDAQAASMASAAGVTVVASAGNSTDTFYSVSSPASATEAIAVAATYDAQLDAGVTAPDAIVPFSSRGPQRGNETTKPDIAAPGYNITSAAKATGTGANSVSGTSIAAAHVAGAVALVRQSHPSWTPQQIKAALVNTAFPIQDDTGNPYPPTYGGMGRLNVAGAVRADLIAYEVDSSGGVGVDFGPKWVTHDWKGYRRIRIENLSDRVRKVAVDSTAAAGESGVQVRPSTVKVTLKPHSAQTIRVWGQIDASKLDFTPDPTVARSQQGPERYYMAEQAGTFSIVDDTSARIRISNGSPESPVDAYLNDTLIATGLQVGETSTYVNRPAGSYTLSFYRKSGGSSSSSSSTSSETTTQPQASSTQDSRGTFLGSRLLQIGAGSDDTMLLRSVFGSRNKVEALTLNENAVQAAADVGRVRFVNNNAVPGLLTSAQLDVYVDGKRLGSSSLEKLTSTGFIALRPGTHTAAFFLPGVTPDLGLPVSNIDLNIVGGQVLTVVTTPLVVAQVPFVIGSIPRSAIRVPFALIPKAASSAHGVVDELRVPLGNTSVTTTIHNTGMRNDPLVAAKRPLGGAFELTYSSTQVLSTTDSVDAARLRYLGVTSNYSLLGQNSANTQVYFAIAAQGDWSTPNEVEFEIFIDSNLDGQADHVLVNASLGSLQSGSAGANIGKVQTGLPNDVFANILYEIQRTPDGNTTFVKTDDGFLNVFPPPWPSATGNSLDLSPFNRRVMFMRAGAANMGLGVGSDPLHFRYQVVTRHRDNYNFGQVVDQTPWLDYNIGAAAINTINTDPAFSYTPIYNDVQNTQITLGVNPQVLASRQDVRLLLIHFHNPRDRQTEVIRVRSGS